jgi:hypothetical protein
MFTIFHVLNFGYFQEFVLREHFKIVKSLYFRFLYITLRGDSRSRLGSERCAIGRIAWHWLRFRMLVGPQRIILRIHTEHGPTLLC